MNNKINKQHLNDFRRFMCDKGFKLVPTIRDFEISRLEDENRTIVIYAGLADSSCFHVKDVDSFYVEDYYSQARVIEQKCLYCQGDKYLIENNNNGSHLLEISKADDSNKYGLVMITPFGLYSKEIKFCPECGRKLGD